MSDNLQEDQQQAVLCDMCTEEDRKPARKTCMKCEISMCVHHLQAHVTTPVLLQTHPLTEPMASGAAGTTKCPQHGKLLEYYCLDDLTCVCVSCAIEDQHRLHNMKTFSTAHKELMEKLNAEQQALAKDENVSLEKWENGEREKLGSSSVRLIEAVSKLRDIALTSVQTSVSARMVSIKTSKSSMQVAQNEKDTFRFLQMFSQVHQDFEKAKAVDLRKGLEPGSDRDKLVQELRQGGEEMVAQAVQLWGSLLILVDPENHQEVFTTSSDLTFDPQSLGIGMSLSKDHRKVFYNSWLGQLSAHTLRIRSVHSTSNFQRWMVSLSEDCDWTIGLCDKESAENLKDGHVYGLRCQGNQLSSLTTDYYDFTDASRNLEDSSFGLQKVEIPKTEKKRRVSSQLIKCPGESGGDITPRPQKVEVFRNIAASSLSFFSRTGQHQRTEILTMKMSFDSSDFFAFVNLEKEQAQKSSNQPPGPQQQWMCSCGKVYIETGSGYSYGGCYYSKSPQAICSCGRVIGGRVIGDPCITEVVCELL
ncbi:uncharacterized protein LOC139919388 [Centroberyx gerrardi]|uniref:uncharacterized protein n=1 Tax=Centroberyx gerrardi TaxID=166262 RepID=UPI003AABFC0F